MYNYQNNGYFDTSTLPVKRHGLYDVKQSSPMSQQYSYFFLLVSKTSYKQTQLTGTFYYKL